MDPELQLLAADVRVALLRWQISGAIGIRMSSVATRR